MKELGLLKMVCIVFGFCAATAIASPAQILTTLHNFAGPPSDGADPYAGLVQASDGNFYGTTPQGGASDNCSGGCGTIFKITASGALTTLHSFDGSDGSFPYGGLVQATDGNFYGTTGGGTVFKITPSGTLTTLYRFNGSDGSGPDGLVQANDGNFYGTTGGGGANGDGTVFKITPSGTLTTLHSFAGYPGDGAGPLGAGFIQATDGSFYGTTNVGGANNCYGGTGCGTVFKITPSGTLTTLYSFCSQNNCADGYYPRAGLMQARDGNLYGTAVFGGSGNCDNGCGTVFKITPSGALTVLYSFAGYPSDAGNPEAVLVQASDGSFYGTTYRGGADNNCDGLGYTEGCGAVFKMTPGGTLTTLHSFNSTDGWGLDAGLIQARDGSFYGTTSAGGANGFGTIFRLVSVRPCFSCALEWR